MQNIAMPLPRYKSTSSHGIGTRSLRLSCSIRTPFHPRFELYGFTLSNRCQIFLAVYTMQWRYIRECIRPRKVFNMHSRMRIFIWRTLFRFSVRSRFTINCGGARGCSTRQCICARWAFRFIHGGRNRWEQGWPWPAIVVHQSIYSFCRLTIVYDTVWLDAPST